MLSDTMLLDNSSDNDTDAADDNGPPDEREHAEAALLLRLPPNGWFTMSSALGSLKRRVAKDGTSTYMRACIPAFWVITLT